MRGRKYTYNGESLYLSDWAKRTNISINTLRNRIVKCGWSPERAFTEPLNLRNAKIPYKGKLYSYAALSRMSGKAWNTIYYRIKGGMSVEEALTTEIYTERHLSDAFMRKKEGCVYPECDDCPFDDCEC